MFINSNDLWEFKNSSKVKFISVISGPLYKGIDFVLKTARLLFEHTKLILNGQYVDRFVKFFEGIKLMQIKYVLMLLVFYPKTI